MEMNLRKGTNPDKPGLMAGDIDGEAVDVYPIAVDEGWELEVVDSHGDMRAIVAIDSSLIEALAA